MRERLLACALLGGAALATAGCAPELGGRASFPVLSKSPLPNYVPVATIDEKRCSHVVLFLFGWGEDANHEALITDVLAKHNGDAIADAELTFFSIPALFYNQSCARVTGTVVRRSLPTSNAQPVPSPVKSGEVKP